MEWREATPFCSLCNTLYKNFEEVWLHAKQVHEDGDYFTCEPCKMIVFNISTYLTHQHDVHTVEKSFTKRKFHQDSDEDSDSEASDTLEFGGIEMEPIAQYQSNTQIALPMASADISDADRPNKAIAEPGIYSAAQFIPTITKIADYQKAIEVFNEFKDDAFFPYPDWKTLFWVEKV